MFVSIHRCYDSHLHLLATGEVSSGLDLSNLKSLNSLARLKPLRHHFRGEWLYAFGWDQFQFLDGELPTREQLDLHFSEYPVCFVRKDGHAVWINTKAYNIANAHAKLDPNLGVYIDSAMSKIMRLIPEVTVGQKKHYLREGIRILNQAGFTHVRDMSCDETQWNLLSELDQKGELTLYVDNNLSFENVDGFLKLLTFAKQAEKN